MTDVNESQPTIPNPIANFLTPKKPPVLDFGMCVRRTTLGTHNYKTRLLRDQETRWTGPGEAAVILLDDFKAKEENDNENRGNILGRLKAGAINDNGERLCDFCESNCRKVGGTLATTLTFVVSP